MNETNNTVEQRPKVSKWATVSMYMALMGLALFLLLFPIVYIIDSLESNAYYVVDLLHFFGLFLVVFGFVASIIALIYIMTRKGTLKGIARAVVGLILCLLLIALFIMSPL
ncbi:MAG: hypothetical protein ACYSTX_02365 [Planctomycetota bacterium]|jgi:hypothetical protein